MPHQIRTLIPAPAGSRRAASLPFLLGAQQQNRLSLHAGKIRSQLNTIDPTLLQAVDLVLVAAAGVIQIISPIFGEYVRVNDRVAGVKNRMVGNIRKGAGRGAGPRHADAEVFQSAGGVYFPVCAVKQIVYAVNLIAFRCPEASHAPAGGFFAQSGAATLPELQIFGSVDRKTAAVFARTVEVIAPIRSAQNEWVGGRERQSNCFLHIGFSSLPKKSFPMFPCLRRPCPL